MTMLEQFVKERNEALFSLDQNKIEAYLAKHGEPKADGISDQAFWAGVYKAICEIKDTPKDVLDKAHAWLSANGFSISS